MTLREIAAIPVFFASYACEGIGKLIGQWCARKLNALGDKIAGYKALASAPTVKPDPDATAIRTYRDKAPK